MWWTARSCSASDGRLGRRLLRAGVAATLAAALAGCGLLPPVPVFRHVNERINDGVTALVGDRGATQAAAATDPRVPRARERPGAAALRGHAFVGVGISGGGSRAASFGAAVFEQLEALGLMEQVSVLSSVSGGGLPTAWYALHGPELTAAQPEAWQRLHAAMAQDFRGEWQFAVLSPVNIATTFASGINRSDLMIDIFERRLFGGATFAALGEVGERRPIVLFNATDITREGVGFVFSEEEFSTRNSRLDSFPIARAVMASGAFPGAFSSVTLRNHPPRRPDGTASEQLTYTHLMDGGPADNYGIDKLLAAARSAWQRSPDRARFACLFIVVDAHVVNHSSERALDRDLRNGPLDYLVDPNVFEAVDTLLAQRRIDSLARLGLRVPVASRERRREAGRFHFAQAEGGPDRLVLHHDRVVDFDLPVQDLQAGAASPRCRSWHVALNEVRGITAGVRTDASGVLDHDDPVLRHRALLWEAVTRIRTDYRLGGIEGCSPPQLQHALHRAARIALREDGDALAGVCQWVQAHVGEPAAARCRAGAEPATVVQLPFRVQQVSEVLGSRVGCVEPAPSP